MIPYPVSHNVTSTAFSPLDINSLVLWYDPNEVTDTGSNNTADILLNQATVPVAPTDANSSGAAVPIWIPSGYTDDQYAIEMAPGSTNFYAASTYSEIQFDTNDAWSVSWWERATLNDYYLFDTTSTGRATQPGMAIYWTSGRLVVELVDGVGGEYSHRTGVIQDTGWHQFTITYNGAEASTGFKIFRNGVTEATVGLNNIIFGTTTHNVGALHLGRKKDGTNYMDSRLGHFMMFNEELSTQNITDLSTYY